jgi:hypothetical protein
MPRQKVVQYTRPCRIESGSDIGIALQVFYEFAPLDQLCDYDLFDEEQLVEAREKVYTLNQHGYIFTEVEHPFGDFWRIFVDPR